MTETTYLWGKVIPLGLQRDFGNRLTWKVTTDGEYGIEIWFLIHADLHDFIVIENPYKLQSIDDTHTLYLRAASNSPLQVVRTNTQLHPPKQSVDGLTIALTEFWKVIQELDDEDIKAVNWTGATEVDEEDGEWNLL